VINVGAQIIAIQPVWVQALTQFAGLSAPAAGYATSIEMQGIALATIALAILVGRIPWRVAFAVALSLIVLGNALSILAAHDPDLLRPVRFLTGIGAGTCVSLGFTTLGRTAKPDRNFGLCITATLIYAATVMNAAPALLERFGLAGLCMLMGSLAVLGLVAVPLLPRSSEAADDAGSAAVDPGLLRRLSGLAAMFAYFLAQGVFWTYAALVGTTGGLSDQAVASQLAVSQFAGIGGALVCVIIGARWGRSLPLTVGILMGVLPVIVLSTGFTSAVFGAAMLVYQFGWNMTHPYLLAVISRFCGTGRHVTYAVVMHKLGLAVGPALAAAVLERSGFHEVLMVSAAAFLASLLLVLWPVRRQAQLEGRAAASNPTTADARGGVA
jgi:predicted MFS family arabinose efflux permease